MSGYLTDIALTEEMNHLATKALYLGVAEAVPVSGQPTLANITEPTTGGYARAAVTWGGATTVEPIQMASSADINIGPVTADMPTCTYAFATDAASGTVISAPTLSLGTATTGGSFAAGTYYWEITATNSYGETVASNQVSATLTANQEQPLSWAAVTGATGYKVYRGTTSGGENVLVTTLGAVTSYTDTGTAGTANTTPPATSTACVGGIWYVWELASPLSVLNGQSIKCPAGSLIIE